MVQSPSPGFPPPKSPTAHPPHARSTPATHPQRALDALIDEQLLADQARGEGIAPDSLMAREVSARAEAVNDSSVQAFYEQNQAGMGGQALEEMRERIHDYLVTQSRRRVRDSYFARLRQEAGVEMSLEPPRAVIEVSAEEPTRGPADAPIQLVEYSDFQCPYCVRAQVVVERVMATYGDRVRHIFRDYPLPGHEHAHIAARAGQCAHDQGRFWQYRALLFANIKALSADDLKRHAATAGLDLPRFESCLDSDRFGDWIDEDVRSGQALGVTGTPAFFVNGRLLSGARPFQDFEQLIEEELRG
ncbi:MAG TPA: DsbA family protein [Candidatus Latescibacteria bacterium]|nr:DsbA family protein [Candidatus Latescibacterota bacterium]